MALTARMSEIRTLITKRFCVLFLKPNFRFLDVYFISNGLGYSLPKNHSPEHPDFRCPVFRHLLCVLWIYFFQFQAQNIARALQDQTRSRAWSRRVFSDYQYTLQDQTNISLQLLPERIFCKQKITALCANIDVNNEVRNLVLTYLVSWKEQAKSRKKVGFQTHYEENMAENQTFCLNFR